MYNFLISKRTLKFVKKEYQAQPKNVKVFENIVLLTFLIMISFDSTAIEPWKSKKGPNFSIGSLRSQINRKCDKVGKLLPK